MAPGAHAPLERGRGDRCRRAQAGLPLPGSRSAPRRPGTNCRRRGSWATSASADPGSSTATPWGRDGRLHRRRLVPDRGRGCRLDSGVLRDRRSDQGPDQIRGRVDLLRGHGGGVMEMAHVVEAAVIAVPDPTWQERHRWPASSWRRAPSLRRAGPPPPAGERLRRWQLPDRIEISTPCRGPALGSSTRRRSGPESGATRRQRFRPHEPGARRRGHTTP